MARLTMARPTMARPARTAATHVPAEGRRGPRALSVRARLTMATTGVVAIALALGATLLVLVLHAVLLRQRDDAARAQALGVAALVTSGRVPDALPSGGTTVLQVVDAQGRVTATSPGGDRLLPLPDAPPPPRGPGRGGGRVPPPPPRGAPPPRAGGRARRGRGGRRPPRPPAGRRRAAARGRRARGGRGEGRNRARRGTGRRPRERSRSRRAHRGGRRRAARRRRRGPLALARRLGVAAGGG